jgi:hypothetical protein
MTVNTPKTPKREPIARKPLTSPRCKSRMPRMAFRTPQTDRFRSVQYNAIETPNDPSDSILHSIRERNIKKHQQKKKKYTKTNIFQDEDSDENMAPVGTSSGSSSQNKNKKVMTIIQYIDEMTKWSMYTEEYTTKDQKDETCSLTADK